MFYYHFQLPSNLRNNLHRLLKVKHEQSIHKKSTFLEPCLVVNTKGLKEWSYANIIQSWITAPKKNTLNGVYLIQRRRVSTHTHTRSLHFITLIPSLAQMSKGSQFARVPSSTPIAPVGASRPSPVGLLPRLVPVQAPFRVGRSGLLQWPLQG